MKKLTCDIESFSSVDLSKCGVYKYAEDVEILLFACSVDDGPVAVYDLANGDELPDEIIRALNDPGITKHAYNCNFERVCLSAWMRQRGLLEEGEFLNPVGWHCDMVWAATLGLPFGLEKVGAVLRLDRQKMKEGKELVKYFCSPCRPTKSNGGRTRNTPADDPEKWELFKKYNARDVETELEIQRRLAKFPVPEKVWQEFYLDQQINDRGVLIDLDLVDQAIKMDEKSKEKLLQELCSLTQLDNPNSVVQLKGWLAEKGFAVDSLGKKEVEKMLEETPDEIARVLALRLQLAKSSIKKYQAMKNCACKDGRARGLFQFYGAARTGRWCLTGDHEVLTDDGWVRLDQWQGGKIACWNAQSEAVSFQKAKQLEFDYNGEMYLYEDVRISQLSTPDHRMRAMSSYGRGWRDMTVEEMSHYGRPCIPLTGYRYHRGCANPLWIRVLIMTQADGHYCADGAVHFRFKKKRKIERCKFLLRKAEIMLTEKTYPCEEVTTIDIPARAVPLWLRQFRTKTFGYWLLDENPDIFFDELPNWDGYYPAPNSIQYTTTNKQNADIVQALAHLSGRTCSVKVKHRPEHPSWKDAYCLNIWLNLGNCHTIAKKPTKQEFNGKVYCAETSTGYFLVRRNGRVWITGNSGRLIQLQNLRRNDLPDLAEARALVKAGNMEAVELLYDSLPDVLSQLVRTALIPEPGKRFVVADFSAIEARVLSWLAGEQWRIDTFASGGDIYCATAGKMFHCNVVKHGENGELRQKGKAAELACIAEGQPVLTDKGEVPIEQVTTDHKVWDGENWVSHEGVVFKGYKNVITYQGLTATPDHYVYLPESDSWITLMGARLRNLKIGKSRKSGFYKTTATFDILNAGPHHRFMVSGVLVHNCGYGGSVGALKAMGAVESGMKEEELKPLVDAWRAANPKIVDYWWKVDAAIKETIETRNPTSVGNVGFRYKSGMLFIDLPSGRSLAYVKPRIEENQFGTESVTYMGVGMSKKWERLESYGPKFVENIVQAVARDLLMESMSRIHGIVAHIHDEVIVECGEVDDICQVMSRVPDWANGLVLNAEGYECDFYMKD